MANLSVSFNPYGHLHQLRRRGIAPLVEAGLARCARCGELIEPGTPWDLGHIDGTNYELCSGSEHRRCNRATETHKRRKV
jgi:hypothetical protein